MGSNRPAARNQRAKLAADLNDLFKDLQSNQVKTVGNYHLGQLVGQGTYGKVKLATHALTGQQVAVKIVAKSHAAIITREIYHWRCLTHPYIAHLHEVLTTESKIYLVTEYCPKGELLEALIRDGRCKPSLAKRWFRQICLAIQYCHSRKIVHRDLKLENILLDSQNNIKLIDFGFTRECESKKLLESYCGSAAYTAPEIIVGKKYSGPEADIWSLGVILYTLLAGYLPFDDDNETVVQDKIVDLDYEMPNELFCKDAQDLIQSILREDPKERFTIEQILAHSWWMPRSDDDEEGGGSGAAGPLHRGDLQYLRPSHHLCRRPRPW
ncbi:Pkinase-domain-containing protein [Linnemannia elongata AG-77]|uniref:Pkinase-domain-containing protein n=1 Tax=Linnemannia elongata AG-77 TaxID=1314771 RepID=A0A197KD69_9FUNG|nr:Pkinase-domain-containing protein [Linnemannia elongata AG-77]